MPDIKTRAVAEKSVKTIDKSAIATQCMKNAYVQAKEKAERTRSTAEESPEEYAADYVFDGTAVTAYESAHLFDRQGRKSVEVTKENIDKAKEYFQRKRLTGQPKIQPPAQVTVKTARSTVQATRVTARAAAATVKKRHKRL